MLLSIDLAFDANFDIFQGGFLFVHINWYNP